MQDSRLADVSIPYMKVVDKDDSNPDDTKVWGDFWVINYDLKEDVLEMVSGGNYPGLMHLKKNDDAMKKIRAEFINDYVDANGLNITAYQDYGWDLVTLE